MGETIKDFFDLLDYMAKTDPSSERMWPFRKSFIEFYWNAGHITSAWIVLGKKAYENRLRFLKEDVSDYGTISPYKINPIHSVLLFQIKNLVLSEWNYNGPVRIWNNTHKHAPKFYKDHYEKKDLINQPEKKINHRPQKYYWQKELSDYIEKYTGIPCPENLRKEIDKFR